MRRNREGQSVLYAVLLMPMLFLVLALAIDIGTLQLERLRLHYAVDVAAVTAASSVDSAVYRRSGQLQLDDPAATASVREYLSRNLALLPDTPDPETIASDARIAIVNQVPARDPFTGMPLERPSVCVQITVSHQFAILGWIGLRSSRLTVDGEAELRR